MTPSKTPIIQLVAIDLGYGHVKVCLLINGELVTFKFPSAVARAKETMVDLGPDDTVYEYKGRKYRVGEDAMQNAVSTRGFEFLTSYGPLLIYVALKKAGVDLSKPFSIGTGLSIVDWGNREEFKSVLSSITVNGETIKPKEVTLFAQGQGIFRDTGSPDGLVSIVDIGYNTLDYLVFKNGAPVPQDSSATRKGAHLMITNIQKLVSRKFSSDISEQHANEIFTRKGFKFGGTEHDMTKLIADEQEDYSDLVVNELKNTCHTFNLADKIIVSGGGAYYIDPKCLPESAVFSEKPFEFSNVRGYFKLLAG